MADFDVSMTTIFTVGSSFVIGAFATLATALFRHKPLIMDAVNKYVETAMTGYQEHLTQVMEEAKELRAEVGKLRNELALAAIAAATATQAAQTAAWAAAEREKMLERKIDELKNLLERAAIREDRRDVRDAVIVAP